MIDEVWLLAQKIQADAINAEIQSMVTENQLREQNKEAQAYSEKDFYDLSQVLYSIYNDIMINR